MQTKRRELFTTIRTEGAILPADLLQRVAEGDGSLEGHRPEDYHLSGEKLNEAVNRAWNRLLGAWKAFQTAREKLLDHDLATSPVASGEKKKPGFVAFESCSPQSLPGIFRLLQLMELTFQRSEVVVCGLEAGFVNRSVWKLCIRLQEERTADIRRIACEYDRMLRIWV